MRGGPAFVDREVFAATLAGVPGYGGTAPEDVATMYGDMSRLVVALLAGTPTAELRALYNRLGWSGSANARVLHEAAKAWMDRYHPGRRPPG